MAGLIALPTLIHRGPGSSAQPLNVLFFSIRPLYKYSSADARQDKVQVADIDEHDYSEQVHASWLLARMDDENSKSRIRDANFRLGHVLGDYE